MEQEEKYEKYIKAACINENEKIREIAIIGDFSVYDSKSLKDFIYECNNGKDIFFLPDEKSGIEKLSNC